MRNVLRIFVLTYLSNISFRDFIAGQSLIKGHVIDATSGEPLIGASVILKDDPTKGTVTDFDGTFELRSESFPVVLYVSYIGYSGMDYNVASATQKNKIMLAEESVTIDLGVEIKGQRVSDKQRPHR
ncbi:MAG: carboxypeptidase-like regulatory domain-containing protein [Saprospiraceae bacterium]|nr:carboxypeptidase-like regulatory domain-containing protein [Saprospiraceae bacterium]